MTDAMSIGQAVDDALAAYEELAALAETVEDEWTYVTDLAGAWRERLEAVAAERGGEPVGAPEQAAVRAGHRRGRAHPRPAPGHRLALDVPAGRARRSRRAAVRFQDAARDARAVTYAAIQADPVVARAAEPAGRRQRRAAPAGTRGHERRDDSTRIGWRTMFPALFGPGVVPSGLERSEAILAVSLAIADRGDQARNQLRGALVESLTAELLARRVGAGAVRRERRILFDGVPARSTPTTSPSSGPAPPRPTTASGAHAASTRTCCTSSTTPEPTRRRRVSGCA